MGFSSPQSAADALPVLLGRPLNLASSSKCTDLPAAKAVDQTPINVRRSVKDAVATALSDYGVVGDVTLASTYANSVERVHSPDPEAIACFETVVTKGMLGGTVLDIGCGSGRQIYDVYLPRQPASVVGLDLSPVFVQMADAERKRRAFEEPSVIQPRFEQGDMHGLLREHPEFRGSFDLLVSCFALHYCDNLPALFQECWQVLKPGGKLTFLVNMARLPTGHQLPENVRNNPTVAVQLGPDMTVNNKIYSEQEY
jgi:SAM-dependent methyltransferase